MTETLGKEMHLASKVIYSVVAVGVTFAAGVLGFMALPINWRIGSLWISWSAMVQNGALFFVVLLVSWFALRAIWKSSKKEEASGSDALYRE